MAKELKVGIAIEARDGFSGPSKRIGESSSRLSRHIEAGQKRLGEARGLDASLKRMGSLDQKLRDTRREMDRAAREAEALGMKFLATARPTMDLADSYPLAKRRSASLSLEHSVQKEELAAPRSLKNRSKLRHANL